MTESNNSNVGQILWHDLTVNDAESIRDFYTQVVGWESSAASMGEYDDYNISTPAEGETVAGVCHARGPNVDFPAQWLMYVRVANVDASVEKVLQLGGKVIVGPKPMGSENFCVVQDPAGAYIGLMSES